MSVFRVKFPPNFLGDQANFSPLTQSHHLPPISRSPKVATTLASFCSELYVDGNKLQCEGLIELIKMVADKAEEESIAREKEKEEAAATNAQRTGARNFLGVSTTMSTQRSGSAVSTKSTSSAR